jgi:hypothetical protein
METSKITILGTGSAASQGSLDENRLSGVCSSTRMLIGPGSSTGLIQSCDVIQSRDVAGGFMSTATTATTLDCTLKCSVTVAVPSHQGSILQNSVSAKNFSLKILSPNFGQTTYVHI